MPAELHEIVFNNDLIKLEEYFENHQEKSINQLDSKRGLSALAISVETGNFDIFEYLLKKNADINLGKIPPIEFIRYIGDSVKKKKFIEVFLSTSQLKISKLKRKSLYIILGNNRPEETVTDLLNNKEFENLSEYLFYFRDFEKGIQFFNAYKEKFNFHTVNENGRMLLTTIAEVKPHILKDRLLLEGNLDVGPTEGSDKGTTVLHELAAPPEGREVITYILKENPHLLTHVNLNAGPSEGPYKGCTVLYWLTGTPECSEILAHLLKENPLLLAQINFNAGPSEGPYKGCTVFYELILTPECPQILAYILKKNPGLLAQINLNAGPSEGPYKGCTVFYELMGIPEGREIVSYILEENPKLLAQINLNAEPSEGPHKGTTVLYWLAGVPEGLEILPHIFKENPGLLAQANLDKGPAEGPYQGTTVVYWLAAAPEGRQILAHSLKENPRILEQLNLDAGPAEGADKGVTALYCLAATPEGRQILQSNRTLIFQGNLNAGPAEGPDKGTTVLNYLLSIDEWSALIGVIDKLQSLLAKANQEWLIETLNKYPETQNALCLEFKYNIQLALVKKINEDIAQFILRYDKLENDQIKLDLKGSIKNIFSLVKSIPKGNNAQFQSYKWSRNMLGLFLLNQIINSSNSSSLKQFVLSQLENIFCKKETFQKNLNCTGRIKLYALDFLADSGNQNLLTQLHAEMLSYNSMNIKNGTVEKCVTVFSKVSFDKQGIAAGTELNILNKLNSKKRNLEEKIASNSKRSKIDNSSVKIQESCRFFKNITLRKLETLSAPSQTISISDTMTQKCSVGNINMS